MTRRTIEISYKIVVIFSLCLGIFLNLINTSSRKALMSYYTLQSNLICLIAFVIIVVLKLWKRSYKNDIYFLIKGAVTIAIIITAVVYHVALAPNNFAMDSLQNSIAKKMWADTFVHTISPILVIIDYLLFDEKGNMKYYYPVIWLIIPLNYVVYVYTYSNFGGRFYSIGGSKKFAYFFLDYTKIGCKGVVTWILFIALAILAISEIFVLFDRKLKWKKVKFKFEK